MTPISPRNLGNGWTVGAGPVAQLPTLTSSTVGSSVWGLGPTAVVVKTQGPIVAGVLVNNIWSLGGVEFGVRREALCVVRTGALPQLQFPRRLVHQQLSDHHRQLGHARDEMDRAGRRDRGPSDQDRQAAGQTVGRRLLQHRDPPIRREVAVLYCGRHDLLILNEVEVR